MTTALRPPPPAQSIAAPGDVLSTTVEALRAALPAVLSALSPGQVLELDLRATRLIDSVGLNLLVTIIKRAKAAGAHVRIRTTHPGVLRILQFSRLHLHAEIQPT